MPPLLSSAGWVFSTSLMTTTACGGAIAILLPVGLARGVISSLQLFLIEEGNVSRAIEQISKDTSTTAIVENPKLLWESMTLGSGLTGRTIRTVASPFLPSTAQMLTRMQQSVDANQSDSKVLASATSGLVEGFLQDKKDTITMFGVLAYGALIGIGFGVDYSYRRIDEGKTAIKDKALEKKEAAESMIKEKKQQFKDATNKMKVWKKPAFHDEVKKNEDEEGPLDAAKEGVSENFDEIVEDIVDATNNKKQSAESKKHIIETIYEEKKQKFKDAVHNFDKDQAKELLEEAKDAAKVSLQAKTQQVEDTLKDQWKNSPTLDKAKTVATDAARYSKEAVEAAFQEKRQQWKDAASRYMYGKEKSEEKRDELPLSKDKRKDELDKKGGE